MKYFYELRYVWFRNSEQSAIRYACFFDIEENRYAVQQADFFKIPVDKNILADADARLAELFIETSPAQRCDWYGSITEAIAEHNRDFESL